MQGEGSLGFKVIFVLPKGKVYWDIRTFLESNSLDVGLFHVQKG